MWFLRTLPTRPGTLRDVGLIVSPCMCAKVRRGSLTLLDVVFFLTFVGGSLRAWPTYTYSLVSLRFPYLSLLCVSPPKQCVRRLCIHKGHVGACGCNIKLFGTPIIVLHSNMSSRKLPSLPPDNCPSWQRRVVASSCLS